MNPKYVLYADFAKLGLWHKEIGILLPVGTSVIPGDDLPDLGIVWNESDMKVRSVVYHADDLIVEMRLQVARGFDLSNKNQVNSPKMKEMLEKAGWVSSYPDLDAQPRDRYRQ